ncbi:MAG TPA: hypothetical protein VKA31_00330 [Mariprofundaceae bacterium]|nr:hypothetical protein [Mariprofundaceae bacterium]
MSESVVKLRAEAKRLGIKGRSSMKKAELAKAVGAAKPVGIEFSPRGGLDRMNGEYIPGLGKEFTIVPLAKWADTSMWAAACAEADEAFRKAGCQIAITFDEQSVLIQEYRNQDRIAFIFHRRVPVFQWQKQKEKGFRNRDLYHVVRIKLEPRLKAALAMAGRWKDAA